MFTIGLLPMILATGVGPKKRSAAAVDRASREIERRILRDGRQKGILGQCQINAVHPAMLFSMPTRVFF